MPYQLHLAKQYCIITFPSTQHALRAEKILQQMGSTFIVIPTPREITSSCGLSIKSFCSELGDLIKILTDHNVQYEGFYEINKESTGSLIARITDKTTN